MDSADILFEILKTGAGPYPSGDMLRIRPGRMALPAWLDPRIKEHKHEIIHLLTHPRQTIEARLEKGSQILRAREEAGQMDEQYERMLRRFEVLLQVYDYAMTAAWERKEAAA